MSVGAFVISSTLTPYVSGLPTLKLWVSRHGSLGLANLRSLPIWRFSLWFTPYISHDQSIMRYNQVDFLEVGSLHLGVGLTK